MYGGPPQQGYNYSANAAPFVPSSGNPYNGYGGGYGQGVHQNAYGAPGAQQAYHQNYPHQFSAPQQHHYGGGGHGKGGALAQQPQYPAFPGAPPQQPPSGVAPGNGGYWGNGVSSQRPPMHPTQSYGSIAPTQSFASVQSSIPPSVNHPGPPPSSHPPQHLLHGQGTPQQQGGHHQHQHQQPGGAPQQPGPPPTQQPPNFAPPRTVGGGPTSFESEIDRAAKSLTAANPTNTSPNRGGGNPAAGAPVGNNSPNAGTITNGGTKNVAAMVVNLEEIAYFMDDMEMTVWWLIKFIKVQEQKKRDAGQDEKVGELVVTGEEELPEDSELSNLPWFQTMKGIQANVLNHIEQHEHQVRSKMFIVEDPGPDEMALLKELERLVFHQRGQVRVFSIPNAELNHRALWQEVQSRLLDDFPNFGVKPDLVEGGGILEGGSVGWSSTRASPLD